MSLRANWGLQSLDGEDPDQGDSPFDPFGKAQLAAMNIAAAPESEWMFDVGLDSPVEEIERLLGVTVRSQNRLLNAGQDCDLRWRSDVSCLACPLSEADNTGSAKCDLCRASIQEERLETFLAAKSVGG